MQIGLTHERPNICNKTRRQPNAINMLMRSCFFFLSKSFPSIPSLNRSPFPLLPLATRNSSLKIMKIEFNSLVRPNYNYVNGTCYYLFIFFSPPCSFCLYLFVLLPGLGRALGGIVNEYYGSLAHKLCLRLKANAMALKFRQQFKLKAIF